MYKKNYKLYYKICETKYYITQCGSVNAGLVTISVYVTFHD